MVIEPPLSWVPPFWLREPLVKAPQQRSSPRSGLSLGACARPLLRRLRGSYPDSSARPAWQSAEPQGSQGEPEPARRNCVSLVGVLALITTRNSPWQSCLELVKVPGTASPSRHSCSWASLMGQTTPWLDALTFLCVGRRRQRIMRRSHGWSPARVWGVGSSPTDRARTAPLSTGFGFRYIECLNRECGSALACLRGTGRSSTRGPLARQHISSRLRAPFASPRTACCGLLRVGWNCSLTEGGSSLTGCRQRRFSTGPPFSSPTRIGSFCCRHLGDRRRPLDHARPHELIALRFDSGEILME